MSAAVTVKTRPLALAPVAPAIPAGIAGELAQVRDLERTSQARFEQVTQGKGAFISRSGLQRFEAWITKRKITEKMGRRPFIVGPSLGVGVATGLAIGLLGEVIIPAIVTGAAVAAAGVGLIPAAKFVRKEAAAERTKAAENLIPLAGTVATMIDRYREAGPGEKALLGQMLQGWLQQMSAARALEPETRAALQRVEAEVRTLPPEHQERARRLSDIGKIIEATDTVTSGTVSQIRSSIDALPLGERPALAMAVSDSLKKSGRVIEYQAKHDLYDMVDQYTAAKAANPNG